MEYFNQLSNTLSVRVGELVPGILGALLVLIIGYFIALGIQRLVLLLFKKTKLDEKLNSRMSSGFELNKFIAKVAYYIVLLFVLLLVLNMMGIDSVLEPLSNMLNDFTSYLPKIVGAVIIGAVGYVIAKLVSEASGVFADGIQNFSEQKAGIKSSFSIGTLLRQLVFIFVFFPILITAIEKLGMRSISDPATDMFRQFLEAIPQIIAAAIIIAIFYIVGKYVISFLVQLLHNLGIDKLSKSIGMTNILGETTPLSKLIGNIAFFFLMFGGIIAAVDKLDLGRFGEILNNVFELSGKIFFGLILLVLGNYLANIAKQTLSQSENNQWLGSLAKFAILGIFIALGLSTMGIGQEIVNLTFGLTVGAVAIAFALAFGLGGREAAGKYAEKFFNKLDK